MNNTNTPPSAAASAQPASDGWYVDSDTIVRSACGGFVADTHDPRSDVGTAVEYDNARLIAAVPDLLAACKQLLASWEHGNLSESVQAIGRAIAKAEGAR